jgi:transcriptional regulator
MYVPAHFDESRLDVLHEFIRQHPFGALVTQGAGGLDANHLPFEIDAGHGPMGMLRAHVARANPVWQDVMNGDDVMVLFRAADAYVSPNWYPSKQVLHRQVPTWNYMVAHAHGKITIRDDPQFVRGVVARLTRSHEAGEPAPWKMSDSSRDFIDMMLGAIVGVEIEITRLVGKVKLSQNKEAGDIANAGTILKERGSHAVGDAMLACAADKSSRTQP